MYVTDMTLFHYVWLITVRYVADWYAYWLLSVRYVADWYTYWSLTVLTDMLTGLLTKYIVSLPSRLDCLVYKLILQTGWALSSTWLAIYQSLALNHRTTLTSLNPLTPRPLPLQPQNSFDSTPDTRPGITPKLTLLHWNLEPLTAWQSHNISWALIQQGSWHPGWNHTRPYSGRVDPSTELKNQQPTPKTLWKRNMLQSTEDPRSDWWILYPRRK